MPWSSLWQGGGGGSVAGAFIAHLDYTHAQMLAGDTPRALDQDAPHRLRRRPEEMTAILPAHGFYLLHTVGAPRGGVEDTTTLVTSGVYRYIRHPLYCSLLLGIWGAFLKRPSQFAGAVAVAGSLFTVATAKVEERENLKKFGADYQTYRSRTKMFVPFIA